MAVLVVAEHDNRKLADATARIVSAARLISPDVDVLVAGLGVDGVADEAAALMGVRAAMIADGVNVEHRLAEALTEVVISIAGRYDVIMFAAVAMGKSCAPRLAAVLDVNPITEVIQIDSSDTFVRPIYAGNALETVQTSDAKRVVTVRTAAFRPAQVGNQASLERIEVSATQGRQSTFISESIVRSARPELGSAKVVVSGGRALGSAEEFQAMLEPLADKLGAAIGASRAAVDAGYAPNDLQIGQTGKIVAPELYIAIGISGAIQHTAGMKDSKVIAAINKDPDAPIFQVADYGLVADYKNAIPELITALDEVSQK